MAVGVKDSTLIWFSRRGTPVYCVDNALSACPTKSVNYSWVAAPSLQEPRDDWTICSGQQRDVVQAEAFVQPEDDVHVLQRLARGALDQVIDDRQHHYQLASLRPMHRNPAHIGATYATGFRVAACRHHVDEWLVGVTLLIQRLEIDRGVRHRCVKRGMDSANHRRQVRNESQPRSEEHTSELQSRENLVC